MNHIYRLIWNDTLGAFVAVAENARARGKRNGLKLVSAAVLSALAFGAQALPTGGQISAGAGSIAQNGNVLTVNQSTQNLAVNWQSFDIGASETVNFVQPNTSAVAINRVLGSDGSQILGKLNANGQVWLLNPNGVLFGKTAQVNVGGLVASTLDVSDASLADAARSFSGGGRGSVVNRGTINGGYVAFVGNTVSNQGKITANGGTAALGAGSAVTLTFAGKSLVKLQVDRSTLNNLAENGGLIRANGGMVLMSAGAKNALLASVVNNTGVIEARTVQNVNGTIILQGGMAAGTVSVGGTLDASAPSGGNGGFVETSAAHVKIADGAKITTAAANGLTGSWLIDPVDFTIAAGSGALTTSGIGATTLSNALVGSNVAIATSAATAGNGDIFVNAAVSWSANKLTLTAHRNININANLNGSGTASLALEYGQGAVAAGNTSNYYVSNGAKVYLPAGANFSTKLGSNGATTNWTVITGLGVQGDASVAPATMTLQGMNTALAGNYVLGADIDASGTATWNANAGFTAVGNSTTKFTGNFDGLGHTITGLTINRTANVPANNYQGLFGYATGSLRNVGMLNSSIAGANVVGTLAGRSDGAISYAYADGGSVTGALNVIGGLVGGVGGSIGNSYANVSVTGLNAGAASTAIGGLVGLMAIGSTGISNSYATGSVSAGTYGGGLVGQNRANISNSYASGAVSCTGGLKCGGFIGDQISGTITNSYWDSAATGRAGVGSLSGFLIAGTVAGLTDIATAPNAQASYTGFDFTNTWRIYEGQTRPLLTSFLTPLTVTATGGSRAYDGTTNGLGVTYSVTPNGNLLGTATANTSSANAGTYTVTPTGLYSNQRGYDIVYASGTVTVNPAPLTVTAGSVGKTYDGLAWSGGNGVTYTGFVNGETAAVLGGTLAYGGTSQGAVNAGSYAITPSGLTSGNYAITFVDGALTVNPASLTVTANNAGKTYDGLVWNGGNGVAYTGFVNGETSAVLGGTLAYGGTSQGAVNVGSYALTPSGLTSGNYAITFVDGALTVNAAPLTVTANSAVKTYDGLPWSGGNGVTYTGFVNGETSSVLGGTLAYGGTSQGAVNAGSYAITPSGLTSGNYAITYADGALTIAYATLPQTVWNAVSQAQATVLPPLASTPHQASGQPHTMDPSSTVTEVAAGGGAMVNTMWSVAGTGATLQVVNGGMKLPANATIENDSKAPL